MKQLNSFIRSELALILSCLGLVTILGYAYTLRYGFFFDDYRFVLETPQSRHLRKAALAIMHPPIEWDMVWSHFKNSLQGLLQKWPNRDLVRYSLAINYSIGGSQRPEGYHIVNIVIHFINGLLVFGLLRALHCRVGLGLAIFGAAIFLAHPIQTNSVTYVLQRNGSMATGFYLMSCLTLLYTLKNQRGKQALIWLSVSTLSFIAALHCKEMTVTFPLLAGVYVLYRKRLTLRWHKSSLALVFMTFGLIGLGLYAASYQHGFWDYNNSSVGFKSSTLVTPFDHFLSATRAFVHYWRLLIFPFPQAFNIDYDFQLTESWLDGAFLFSLGFHLGALAFAFYLLRIGRELAAFGIFWFYLTLLPYWILPERDVLVEYKLYLPSVGLVFLIVDFCLCLKDLGLTTFSYRRAQILSGFAACLVVGVLLVGTYQRHSVLFTEIRLWEDTVRKSPLKSRVHHNLAVAYHHQKQYDKAIPLFLSTIEMSPNNDLAHKNLGSSYMKQDLPQKAIPWFQRAINLNPIYAEAHLALGSAYVENHQAELGLESLRNALALDERLVRAYFKMGEAFEQQGKTPEAVYSYELYRQNYPKDKKVLARLKVLKPQE